MTPTLNITRRALASRTNTLQTLGPQSKLTSFRSSDQKPKRRREVEDKQPKKRLKVEVCAESESEYEKTDGDYEEDDDAFMEDTMVTQGRARMRLPFHMQSRRIASGAVHQGKVARMFFYYQLSCCPLV